MNNDNNSLNLIEIRDKLRKFAAERDWDQFHTPRNLLLALVGEVGELSEIFQWKGEVKDTSSFSEQEKVNLGEELSDVMLYLIRLSDKCDIDLSRAILYKLKKNAEKYPIDLAKSTSKKYNEF